MYILDLITSVAGKKSGFWRDKMCRFLNIYVRIWRFWRSEIGKPRILTRILNIVVAKCRVLPCPSRTGFR